MRTLGFALASVVAVSGCNTILGIDDLSLRDGGTPIDGKDPATNCYGGLVRACFTSVPSAALVLADTIDTGTDPRCTVVTQSAGPDVCAIAGTSITMAGDTVVTGPRALMLVSLGPITVSKKLDASSNTAANRAGPASNSVLCDAAVSGNPGNGGGGGGGAGGTFISMGGGGGAGNGTGGGLTTNANAPQQAMVLRGGCPGGQGGSNVGGAGGTGGAGGNGGGAVYLFGSSIVITAELRASGGGGHHALPVDAGGGGGGSGGMLVLEAPQITVMAPGGQIVAHGAGGGEGSHDPPAGGDGRDDRDWMSIPSGGSGVAEAGNGGNGAFGSTAATNGSTGGGGGAAGGGGGGGGTGAVRFRGQLGGVQISPPPVNY